MELGKHDTQMLLLLAQEQCFQIQTIRFLLNYGRDCLDQNHSAIPSHGCLKWRHFGRQHEHCNSGSRLEGKCLNPMLNDIGSH